MTFLMSPEGDPRSGLNDLTAYTLRLLAFWEARPIFKSLTCSEPGMHRGAKLFFQLAGCNCLCAGGKEVRIHPGQLGAVLKNVPHTEVWEQDAGGQYLHLYVGVASNRLSINLAGLGGACGLPAARMIHAISSVPFVESLLIDHLLRFAADLPSVPVSFSRTFAAVLRTGMRAQARAGGSHLVDRAVDAIQRHPCRSDLSVKVLAQELDCHPDYLSRRFAEEMKQPLMLFVRERRLEVAADLLRSMRIPVAEVAALCGYRDHSYFTKVFHQSRGLTPREFMAQHLRQ